MINNWCVFVIVTLSSMGYMQNSLLECDQSSVGTHCPVNCNITRILFIIDLFVVDSILIWPWQVF